MINCQTDGLAQMVDCRLDVFRQMINCQTDVIIASIVIYFIRIRRHWYKTGACYSARPLSRGKETPSGLLYPFR